MSWPLLGSGQSSPYHMRRGFPTRYRCLSCVDVLTPCSCSPPPLGERSGFSRFVAVALFRVWTMEPHRHTSLLSATPLWNIEGGVGAVVPQEAIVVVLA